MKPVMRERVTQLSILLPAVLLSWLAATPAAAVTELKRGQPAAAMVVSDLDGATVNSADWRGTSLIVIFGELYHDRTLDACRQVQTVLDDPRLKNEKIRAVLVLAQDVPTAELKQHAELRKLSMTILHDPRRTVFGAYHVAVVPSVVVIDPEQRIVHAVAGMGTRFSDVITDAALFSVKKLSEASFEQTLRPEPAAVVSEAVQRAERLTQLARQLAERGSPDLAIQKYQEALSSSSDYAPANLGLGKLLLQRRRLAEAEARFRAVLASDPNSVEANLGLASVQVQRGGEELRDAERIVRELLAANPGAARPYYLLGTIQEQRQQCEAAMASYKKAAELLMQSVGQER